MKVVLLAAGVGDRLGPLAQERPKCLLEFGGRTLLRRHLDLLASQDVEEILVVAGYQSEMVEAEVARARGPHPVRVVHNPDFRRGSLVSMLVGLRALDPEDDVLLMDADVLYDAEILRRLIVSPHKNCFLLDRNFEPGEEPVKICVQAGRLVEFRKQVEADLLFETIGESVGFFRFDSTTTAGLVKVAVGYLEADGADLPYEECIRDLLLEAPERFEFEDVTGLAWIEIDFPEDVERAAREILPKVNA